MRAGYLRDPTSCELEAEHARRGADVPQAEPPLLAVLPFLIRLQLGPAVARIAERADADDVLSSRGLVVQDAVREQTRLRHSEQGGDALAELPGPVRPRVGAHVRVPELGAETPQLGSREDGEAAFHVSWVVNETPKEVGLAQIERPAVAE